MCNTFDEISKNLFIITIGVVFCEHFKKPFFNKKIKFVS